MGKRRYPSRREIARHLRQDGRNLVWTAPVSNRVSAGDVAGCTSTNGYIWVGFLGGRYAAHQLAWILFHGEEPPSLIDHINGDRSDNRPENLRAATHSQNAANSRAHSDNASGVKGVHLHKDGRWRAQITVDGRRLHLGCFENIGDAASAYLDAASRHFGEFGGA